MVEYTTTIFRFEKKGEKTGWIYIEIPADIAYTLNPGVKVSFKVKGKLDQYKFKNKSLLPMGGGSFIMPLDAAVRKNILKKQGAMLKVQLDIDSTPFIIPDWMIECLDDEPIAKERFYKLPKSHQKYYVKWVESAKTEHTRTKRIVQIVRAFERGLTYAEMIRMGRNEE